MTGKRSAQARSRGAGSVPHTRDSPMFYRVEYDVDGGEAGLRIPLLPRGPSPRSSARAHDSVDAREPSDRHRGFERAEYDPESLPGAGELGCRLVGVPFVAGVQGRVVRERSGRRRSLLPVQQTVQRVRCATAEYGAARARVAVRGMRHGPRSGRERREEHTRRRACGARLRRWCETAPQLMLGGNCR